MAISDNNENKITNNETDNKPNPIPNQNTTIPINQKNKMNKIINALEPNFTVEKYEKYLKVKQKHTLSTASVSIFFPENNISILPKCSISAVGIFLSFMSFPIGLFIVMNQNDNNQKSFTNIISNKLSELQMVPKVIAKIDIPKDAISKNTDITPCTDVEVKSKALVPIILGAIASFIFQIIFCCFTYAGPILSGIVATYLLMRQFPLSRLSEYPPIQNPFIRYAIVSNAIGVLGIIILGTWARVSLEKFELIDIVYSLFNGIILVGISAVGSWIAYRFREKLIKE